MAGFFPELWGAKTLGAIKRSYEKIVDIVSTIVDYTPMTEGQEAAAYNGPMIADLEAVDLPAADYQDPAKTAVNIPFDQTKGVPFKVKDVEASQSNVALMTEYTETANNALRKGWSKYIIKTMQEGIVDDNNIEMLGTALSYDDILAAKTLLDELDVPESDRWAAVPAAHYNQLLKIDEFISRDKMANTNAVPSGVIGTCLGFTFQMFKTNKVDEDGKFVGTKDKNASLFYSKLCFGFGRQKKISAKYGTAPLVPADLVNIYNVFGGKMQIPEYAVMIRDKAVVSGG